LAQADQDNGGFISDLFWLLDTPGAIARGGLANGLEGATQALTQSTDDRVDGRELLRSYGLAGADDNWYNFAGGLAAEMALDPLAWASGATKALTGAGKAAAKAGLLSEAPELLSKQFLRGQAAPEIASRAARGQQAIGRAVSEIDVAGRPLVGRRAASKFGTLQDLVSTADNGAADGEAYNSVLDALGGGPDSIAKYEKLKGQVLGKDIGLGLPFMDPVLAFNIPGGTAANDLLDSAMSGVRWSLPGRALKALTDNSVGNAIDAESQMLYAGADAARKKAQSEARGEAVDQAARLYEQEPDVFSEGGNRAMGRLIENPKFNPNAQADDVWKESHPAARAYMDWWREQADELPQQFSELGLRGGKVQDPNVSGYLPRQADGAFDQAAVGNPSLGRVLKTITGDQLKRSNELKIPGGRDRIAFDLSKDPFVAGAKRQAKTDEEARAYIAEKLFGDPAAKSQQTLKLARLLNRLPDELIKDAPLYAQHPAESIMRYVEGRAGAAATQNAIYDSLAGIAVNQSPNLVEGGGYLTMKEALGRIGARTSKTEAGEIGARQQMRERLAAKLGIKPDEVELANIAVPEDHVNRLLRVRDGFSSPQAAQEMTSWLDEHNLWWKESILAMPSKTVRDLYSGAYSNWLEGAYDRSAVGATKKLTTNSAFDTDFLNWLNTTPRYNGLAEQERAVAYYSDLAKTGLLDGSYLADRGASIEGGALQNMLVGVNPMRFGLGEGGALRELGGDWTKVLSRQDNPILKASRRAGALSDTINRLTGYNSLLAQGVSPTEAARRMKRAHVDYSSLTPQERYIRDKLFPFYAYSSRIFQEVLRQLAERPGGRYGQGIRITERLQDNDQYVPEELRSQFAVPINPDDPTFGWLAPQDGGVQRFFTDVDLPGYDQLNLLRTSGGLPDIAGTLTNVAKMAGPRQRIAYELLTGTDSFTGEPLDYTTRSSGPIGKAVRAITGDSNDGRGPTVYLDKALDLVPFASRPARILSGLYEQDSGVGLPSRAVNTAFNVAGLGKLRDITEDRVRQDQIRRLEGMAGYYSKEYASPYIPEHLQPFVPQDAQDALELSRELRKEGRDIRRSRVAGF
jgi:hypothetical protein